MKVSDVYSGKTLKAEEFGDEDKTVTITAVNVKEFDKKEGGKESKIVLSLKDDKDFVVNRTNAKAIEKVLGSDDTEVWVGKQITLYSTEVQFGAETMLGIRVRLKAPLKRPQQKKDDVPI